ncbi:MAG: SCO family protein [Flavobacteriales bacterium]|nr:SCO family protein [Flavobacteriia bacterium]NCP06566.1 SCO family protein [Flavobacteriales bacterium]PIV94340.1 MAG: SCO family protein [Flavobacteriaceae bacterium CG17_big_fil_post_rev_8_21_14_2_50_33_15]PIY10404.1 MAG: SCO family protein [Flavobacteriaceae bacterium CG_4_10_14_3_um_filter_33_47]PJB20439.1 MAG: SCO family protein [Flavobacteriaceae bacterium CG_4_9_14_3_um_filter_33_16]
MKKNNYSYIGISFIILVFGIYFIPKIIDRITNKDVSRQESRSDLSEEEKNKPSQSDLAFIEINGESKKVPDFSFVNQNGKVITNKDYIGKVYVIEFFFTTCPTICPRMNANLIQIQNSFTEFENFGIASFTINPEHDTAEVLKAYADSYGVTNPNWNLMTGNQETIYKLANEGFNLYTAKDESVEGGFEHSGNFALIDKNGFIRSRVVNGNPIIFYNGMISPDEKVDDEGMPEEITILKEDITKLLKE